MKKRVGNTDYELISRPEDLLAFAKSFIFADISQIINDWIEGSRDELEQVALKLSEPEAQRVATAAAARIEVCRYFLSMFESLVEDEREENEDGA